jgi:hypothetical protein
LLDHKTVLKRLRGKIKNSDARVASRLAICKECEHYFERTGTCKKCGCFMKIKSRIPGMKCPIGKWDVDTK